MQHITKRNYITKKALRLAVHKHLINSGFSKNDKGYFINDELDKQKIRDIHKLNREERLEDERKFIKEKCEKLIQYFANGKDIVPEKIDPRLVEVTFDTPESDLFRLATSLWSVPVSRGFGRRIRFLIFDNYNDKLIGLFALGDPVFNLTARDQWVGWTHEERKERLVHVMDAYVVGAVPPYSQIIGGKLVASLIASNEVMKIHEKKYLKQTSIISGIQKHARLSLITTTSALGHSSIYNRLLLPGGIKFIKIGTTKGFGHFHLSGEIFDLMRRYLIQSDHPYASGNKFGMGPNWRIRVARTALENIGFNGDHFLKHGIEREVYALPIAHNWKQILQGQQIRVRNHTLPASEITQYCLQRWMIPRSNRDNTFKIFNRTRILECLNNGGPPSKW